LKGNSFAIFFIAFYDTERKPKGEGGIRVRRGFRMSNLTLQSLREPDFYFGLCFDDFSHGTASVRPSQQVQS